MPILECQVVSLFRTLRDRQARSRFCDPSAFLWRTSSPSSLSATVQDFSASRDSEFSFLPTLNNDYTFLPIAIFHGDLHKHFETEYQVLFHLL